jgi:hypothetical protein
VRLPSTRNVLKVTGWLRMGFGGAMLAAPGVFGRLLGLPDEDAARVAFLTRMVGGREVALGVGSLHAAGGEGGRSWLVGQMISDGIDAAAVTAGWRRGAVSGRVAALTAGFVAVGIGTEAAGLR